MTRVSVRLLGKWSENFKAEVEMVRHTIKGTFSDSYIFWCHQKTKKNNFLFIYLKHYTKTEWNALWNSENLLLCEWIFTVLREWNVTLLEWNFHSFLQNGNSSHSVRSELKNNKFLRNSLLKEWMEWPFS